MDANAQPKSIAVIVNTYNQVPSLRLALLGYTMQTHRDFELVIADDGSTEDTRELLQWFAKQYRMRVVHMWQPDVGFRKCRALNQGIIASSAEYVITTDGDCIPHPEFVAAHLKLARPRRYLSAGYLRQKKTAADLTEDDVLSGRIMDPEWQIAAGTKRSRTKKFGTQPFGTFAKLMNMLSPTKPGWHNHNSSGWKSDIFEVNGYDERMGYGAQDREMGERLDNLGVRGLQARWSALTVHIEHPRPYDTTKSREFNKGIRRQTRANKTKWTPYGIAKEPGQAPFTPPAPDVITRVYGG
jgi:glycosyltransferase involved in cell wall biosynthesis